MRFSKMDRLDTGAGLKNGSGKQDLFRGGESCALRAARPWPPYAPEPLTVLATGSPPKFAPWTSVHTSKGACQLLRKFHQGTVHSGRKNIVLLLTFSKGRKRPCNLTSHLLLQVCVTSQYNGPLPRPPGLRVYLCLLDWRRVRDSIPRDMGCPLGHHSCPPR